MRKVFSLLIATIMILALFTNTVAADFNVNAEQGVVTGNKFIVSFYTTEPEIGEFYLNYSYPEELKYTGSTYMEAANMLENTETEGTYILTWGGVIVQKRSAAIKDFVTPENGKYKIVDIEFEINKDVVTDEDVIDGKVNVDIVEGDDNYYLIANDESETFYDSFIDTIEIAFPDPRPEITDVTVAAKNDLVYTGSEISAKDVVSVDCLETDNVFINCDEEILDAGDYTVNVTVKRAGYKIYTKDVKITVSPAPITEISIGGQEITYTNVEGLNINDCDFKVLPIEAAEFVSLKDFTLDGDNDFDLATLDVKEDGYRIGATPVCSNSNYTLDNVRIENGYFFVIPKDITVKIDDKEMVYGNDVPEFTSDAPEGVKLNFMPISNPDAVEYDINATVASDSSKNYNVTVVKGNLVVNKRPATIKVKDVNQIQGKGKQAFEFIFDGFLANEEPTDVVASLSNEYSDVVGFTSDIVIDSYKANNYNVETFKGTYKVIDKIPVEVTITAGSKTYGEDDPVIVYTVDEEYENNVEVVRASGENVGEYSYNASLKGLDETEYKLIVNYVTDSDKFVINKKPATIVVDDAEKFVGEVDPEFTGTATGFINNDASAIVYSREDGETAGTYIITATIDNNNYDVTVTDAKLCIKEQKVTMTVGDVRFSTCGSSTALPMPEITSDCPAFTKEVEEGSIIIDLSFDEAYKSMVDGQFTPGTYKIDAKVSDADVKGRYDVTVKSGNLIITNNHATTYKPAKAATCTEPGNIAHYYCSGCKTYFEDANCTKIIKEDTIIPALGHKMIKHDAKDATCTEDGNVEYYSCSTCGKNYADEKGTQEVKDVIIPAAHKLEKVDAKDNTCTTDGNIEYYKCNGTCGKNYADEKATNEIKDVVIPAAHKLEKVEAKAETCTTDGNIEYYRCNGTCGKNYTDEKATDEVKDVVISAAHKLEKVEAKDNTCTEDGNVAYYKCNGTCGKNYADENATQEVKDVVIPAAHGNVVEIPAIAPTCKNVGLTAGEKCTICGVATVKPEPVAKLAHTEKTVDGKAATCTETGVTEGKICLVCETVIEEQKEIPALGHNWTEWDTTTDPAKKTRECQNDGCGEKEEYVIDAECEHAETFTLTKIPATCDATGIDEIYCSNCGELVEEKEVAKLEHNLEEIAENAATCVAEGNIAHKHCTLCGKNFDDDKIVENIVIPVADHVWGTADNNGIETCTNGCGATKRVAINTTTEGVAVAVKKLDEVLDETDDALVGANAVVVPQINVDELAENAVSDEIKTQMDSTKTGFESLALEINISKKVTLNGGFEYEVEVAETPALVRIDIALPAELQNKINYYVARVHKGIAEKITTTANNVGEYIEIDKVNHVISLFVKNFSEYAVVGDNYVASSSSSSGGGGASKYTVKFESNGGSTVKQITVNKNDLATEPTAPTKDGFKFDGWYTDKELTKAYDFSAKVTKSFTLYAKWVEIEKEPEVVEPDTSMSFKDVKVDDWFYANVQYVVKNKLMNGVANDRFAPNDTLTRAMLVTVLYRNAGEPATNRSIPFGDVDMGSYYANAVSWAKQNGIVNGVTENEFAPNNNITREQIAAIMFRYAQYNGMDAVTLEENLHFEDNSEISEYAVSAMNWAVGTGLMKGKTATTINPKDNATRAEIAAILQRFIESNK